MTIRELLRDLLGREREPGPRGQGGPAVRQAAAVRAPGAGSRGRKQQSRETFEERLRALAQERDGTARPIVTGRLRMIGLSRVKAQLGKRWPRVADLAHARAQRVLERRLADEDVYLRAGDTGYLVLFASLSGEEAAFKAQALAREIAAHLLGDLPAADDLRATGELLVRVAVHEIGADELGEAPDLDALIAALDERDAAGDGVGDGGREAEGERDGRADGPAPAGPRDAGPLGFTYLPVWSRRGGAVVLYNCVPVRRAGDRGGAAAGGFDPAEDGGAPVDDLDRRALLSVLDAIAAMQREGRTALVVAPVRWAALVQLRARREYLDLCQRIPPCLRRQLGLSVVGIPPGVWRTPLAEHLAPLQPFTRFLAADVAPHPSQVWKFPGTGVQALTFDAAGLDPGHAARYRLIEGFVRRAHARRLAAGALSVGDRAVARALLAAGVDFLAGDAVAPPVPVPGTAYELTLAV